MSYNWIEDVVCGSLSVIESSIMFIYSAVSQGYSPAPWQDSAGDQTTWKRALQISWGVEEQLVLERIVAPYRAC